MAHPNLAAAWKLHKNDMDNFFLAAGYSDEDEKRRVAILLYSLGQQNRTVFENFVFNAPADKEKYKEVTEKFDTFFEPKRVTTHEAV